MAMTPEERRALARESRAYGAVLSNEDIPPTRELERLTYDELLAVLATYGVQLDEERLDAEIRAALASDAALIDRGVELDAARLDALARRVQRVVAMTARSVANQTMGDMRQSVIDQADQRPVDERWSMWVTASGKSKCCPDCKDRHGIIARPDWWDAAGRPRDGLTVCGGDCKCSLVPCGPPKSGEDGTRA